MGGNHIDRGGNTAVRGKGITFLMGGLARMLFMMGCISWVSLAAGGAPVRSQVVPRRTPRDVRPKAKTPEVPRKLGPGEHTISLQQGDRARSYVVHVPPNYRSDINVPVVLVLHAEGGIAASVAKETGWSDKADAIGFLAVYPDALPHNPDRPRRMFGNPQTWNDGSRPFQATEDVADDVGFIEDLLDDLPLRFGVDDRRIFVTGFSSGGSMAYRLGVELSGRIAAIAPVAGYLRLKILRLNNPVPLLAMVGTEDPQVPLNGGRVRLPGAKDEVRPPVRESVETWARMLGCPMTPRVTKPQKGVLLQTYGPGKAGSEALFYTIEDLGHVWPGGKRLLPERLVGKPNSSIKANDVIWRFFLDHPKRKQ